MDNPESVQEVSVSASVPSGSLSKKRFDKQLKKMAFPLVALGILVVAGVAAAFLATSKSKVGTSVKAAVCKDTECSVGNACQIPPYKLTVDGRQYECLGANQWKTPEGRVVLGDQQGPLVDRRGVTSVRRASLESDYRKGCVVTFGFVKNGQVDPSLEPKALAEINKIKDKIRAGLKCDEVLSLVSRGMTQQEEAAFKAQIKANPVGATARFRNFVNPFSAFLEGISTNFAFDGSLNRHEKLGEFFYQDNPDFRTNLLKLVAGGVTEPFPIYWSSDTGKTKYGYMIISVE